MSPSDEKNPGNARILLVDDEPSLLSLFKRTLGRSGYECRVAENGRAALEVLERQSFDVVVTDIDMPEMDGMELTRKVVEAHEANVIIMTGKVELYRYDQLIRLGASDFVEKPFSVDELELRIKRVLNERKLKADYKKSHDQLKQAYIDSIHRLVMASEFKDEETGDHIVRIGEYSRLMAEKLAWSKQQTEMIHYASPMHDVGKIGIPDKILLKPGRLSASEFEVIKTHTLIGGKLLSDSGSDILIMAQQIALNHHEKFNGRGYPNGITGESIPLSGRIVAIVDAFDALTSKRPYKEAYPFETAYEIIKEERGRQFDPDLTDIFLDNFNEFESIRKSTKEDNGLSLNLRLSQRDRIKE